MIMCVLLCYPVSIRIYYQQGGLFLVTHVLKMSKCELSLKVLQIANFYQITHLLLGELSHGEVPDP